MTYHTAQEIFAALPRKFDPAAAGDLNAVFQFDLTGDSPAQWYVIVEGGQCDVGEGRHGSPSVTLSMAEDTWIRVVAGEISAVPAFMTGQIRAQGNIFLAQRLGQVFGLAL